MSISKIFIPNFVCVLTKERHKTFQTGFLFCRLGHAPGHSRCPEGQFFFSNMVMWHIKSTGMTSRTEYKYHFHPRVKLVPLGEVKRSNIIIMSISKISIPNLCVFSQIKDRKHIEQNFHSVARVMPLGGTWGCWGESKTR